MPPVYTSVQPTQHYDGKSLLDLRSIGLNLIYLPNFLSREEADSYYQTISCDPSCLSQHSYLGNFNRTIVPKRLTYAYVPTGRHYRFKGKDLHRRPDGPFARIFHQLVSRLPEGTNNGFRLLPDASVVNGYRYNGVDYISPHTDDEKFLEPNNTLFWTDPTVATLTLLRDPEVPMTYYAGNPETGVGVSIAAQHGSLLLQGRVLHEVRPLSVPGQQTLPDRISVTLRRFRSHCYHLGSSYPSSCAKPMCPQNLGPSNYLYYSNSDSLATQAPDITLTQPLNDLISETPLQNDLIVG